MIDAGTKTGAPAGAAASNAMQVRVPTGALEINGTAPAEGDEVEFTVKGRAVRTEGPLTVVEPLEVNGQPLPAAPAAAPKLPGDMSEDEVLAALNGIDEEK